VKSWTKVSWFIEPKTLTVKTYWPLKEKMIIAGRPDHLISTATRVLISVEVVFRSWETHGDRTLVLIRRANLDAFWSRKKGPTAAFFGSFSQRAGRYWRKRMALAPRGLSRLTTISVSGWSVFLAVHEAQGGMKHLWCL
jgi:hypothetical protein